MQMQTAVILVSPGRRGADPGHVSKLAESIRELGLLNPETKNGGDRKSDKIRTRNPHSDFDQSFVADTSKKLGMARRTVEEKIQTAKNLTPETREIIKSTDMKITQTAALKLSRLKPEQQKEAASLLAAKEIKSVDEYTTAKNPVSIPVPEPAQESPAPIVFSTSPGKIYSTFKESVAELKNNDSEFDCTPDYFVSEISLFSKKFIKDIEWYNTPDYEAALLHVSVGQFEYLRQIADSMHLAIETLLNRIERMQKNELQKEPLSQKPREI